MNIKKYFEKNPPVKLSDKEEIAIKLGSLITNVRLDSKLSQAELAKKIGTQQPSLARAEAGDVAPSVEFLYKIAKVFGKEEFFMKKLSEIFGLEEDNFEKIIISPIQLNKNPLYQKTSNSNNQTVIN